jgi:DNA-binding GntR family transcriptional regulator
MTVVSSQRGHQQGFSLTQDIGDRLRDRTADELSSLIITLQLEPGAVLDEAVLSQKLSYGRTPLREAFQRLADEGLALILPRRAVPVSEITVTDLQQVHEAGLVCEAACARLTPACAASSDVVQHIERLAPDTLAQDLDWRKWSASNFNIHNASARVRQPLHGGQHSASTRGRPCG